MAGIHRKRKRETTVDDYAAMLTRMIRAYGNRIGQDPEATLAWRRQLEAELSDAVNTGLHTANKVGGHSINRLAEFDGTSKQAIYKRVLAGEQIVQARKRVTMRKARPRALPPGSTGD